MGWGGFGWGPYVSVAERRRKALKKMEQLRKTGRAISPVVLENRTIAQSFWGKAWCDNLESYSDFENRMPRGRTYVRNGSVLDLQIEPGRITALVSGSHLYSIEVKIAPVAPSTWKSICADCSGSIDSLVELLQGKLSKAVMERISRQRSGLFPTPEEIELQCSCLDWANMCKHVAAVLYGVGARLDQSPELLFRLRQADEKKLISQAGKTLPRAAKAPVKVLGGEDLSKLFGLDLAASVDTKADGRYTAVPVSKTASRTTKKSSAKPAAKKFKGVQAGKKLSAATKKQKETAAAKKEKLQPSELTRSVRKKTTFRTGKAKSVVPAPDATRARSAKPKRKTAANPPVNPPVKATKAPTAKTKKEATTKKSSSMAAKSKSALAAALGGQKTRSRKTSTAKSKPSMKMPHSTKR
jgi:uncharacterized Zn finger protein